MLSAAPLGRDHEQGFPLDAAKHAGEAAAVEIDRLQHLATLANAHATLIGNVAIPNGALAVDANAVRHAAVKVGPYAPIQETAVGGDVERGKPLAI
jgi:hypothetical protein